MSDSPSPVLFLVHGVGNTASGEMEAAVRNSYPGLGEDDVIEVVWNKVRDSIFFGEPARTVRRLVETTRTRQRLIARPSSSKTQRTDPSLKEHSFRAQGCQA